ncbi:hypothetical protein DFJ69_2421 [Thermomonospora umbrina]|uniref:Uncharacterized protein n=1 Tax=Thermomonospora umbrina TaxID=111806 RepID=A0A3D9SM95_9ACTN|nr:hypothetical protein DFJ69_2421 [Thermomonospora umbrina]
MNATPHCPVCGLDAVPSGSSHSGSAGTLRYRRCVCGLWLVVENGEVIATAGVSDFTASPHPVRRRRTTRECRGGSSRRA